MTATRRPWGERARLALREPARRLRRLSVRARLVLLTVALLTAALTVSSAVSLVDLRRPLVDQVDRQLGITATIVLAGLDLFPNPADRDQEDLPEPSPTPPAQTGDVVEDLLSTSGDELVSDFTFAFLAEDGRTILSVRPAPQDGVPDPELSELDAAAVASRQGEPFGLPAEGGAQEQRWRALAVPYSQPDGDRDVSLVVAASVEEVDATVRQIGVRFAVVGVAVLAVLAVAGWLAVRAGLRPLRRVEETATAIAGGDLSRRVPDLAAPNTEVGRLSAALNGMLTQIEESVAARAESEARMRRFVADVSHELRTPLFGIKGFTELHRMGGLPDRTDVDRTMERIESESARLTRLVEDLLLLARLDEHPAGGSPPARLAPMDLRTLAADALHDLRGLDASRPVTLTGPSPRTGASDASQEVLGPSGSPSSPSSPGEAPVLGDESQLRQVVTNLVGNAVAHTPPGTPVRIGVGTIGGQSVLEVADEGPGLTQEQAGRVFDRFYRADRSRSRASGAGAGLGLAIVQSVVAAHGGEVELETELGRGATFRVRLQAAWDETS